MFTEMVSLMSGKVPTMQNRIQEARRIVNVRQLQMHAAALTRNAGEISQDEWDGFAARYAASVREWQVLQQIEMNERVAVTETARGETWVQG